MKASAFFPTSPRRNRLTRIRVDRALLVAVAIGAGFMPSARAQVTVDLGSAASFAILGGSAITFTSGPITISGDIGSSPTATVNGLGNVSFVTGADLTGTGVMPGAKNDLVTAFDAITAQAATSGTTAFINGATLTPGVYAITSAGTDITGTLTLNGSASDIFIFKMSATLNTAVGSQILLTGGIQASNVFWQVGSSATLGGSSSHFEGNVLALTSITMGSGSIVDGRLLAENGAVTLGGSDSVTVSAIPEPAITALLAALGAFGLAGWRRRRAA